MIPRMPSPLPLPIRVLVKGASTALWTSFMSGPRTDLTFPRAIEAEVLKAGHPIEVHNTAILGDKTIEGLRRWNEEAIAWSPDVVVMVYGHYECVHLFLPHWFERHVNRPQVSRPWARAYRRLFLRPLWKFLAEIQAFVDGHTSPVFWRRRIRRTAADISDHIEAMRQLGSPLFLVMELLPLAPAKRRWFPGMTPRIEAMNAANRATAERLGDDVRFVEIAPLVDAVAGGDLDVATPDGYHYTPELHRAVGERLAREILDWAAKQPHLAVE
jgi:hypothetical protein